ncbi:hypothetical protein [Pseudarthrobacter sp. PS3-L1]|uniref:hypothetical protein n=1 Tax=Pseudarthrobacter sp. PS3-L1 TaxID=3046207 RepID=UPI0024B95345|nr:hypothetical protein [Pseudarthrobacter sp. PS3-L1]MDJ0319772.1 hypothetical protein [Pseudarthrobacter sp. PS3-L1]
MSNPPEPHNEAGQPQEDPNAGRPPLPPPPPVHQPTVQEPVPAAQHPAPSAMYHPGPAQYPASGPGEPYALPGEQPPAKSRKKLWIILGIVGAVIALLVVAGIVLFSFLGNATSKVGGLADDFTNKVIAGESAEAYDEFLDPALKEQLSKEEFVAGVASLNLNDSCTAAYSELSSNVSNGTTTANVSGQITCQDQNVDLAYGFTGTDELLMVELKLRPAA